MECSKKEQVDKKYEMPSFQVAKKNYYEFKKVTDENFEGLVTAITDYVSALENKNKELLEIIKDDYQYFSLKNNPETGRAKYLNDIIIKYKGK